MNRLDPILWNEWIADAVWLGYPIITAIAVPDLVWLWPLVASATAWRRNGYGWAAILSWGGPLSMLLLADWLLVDGSPRIVIGLGVALAVIVMSVSERAIAWWLSIVNRNQ